MKRFLSLAVLVLFAASAWCAPLSFQARTIIPTDVQQIISVDYRSMQNSPTAMALKARVLPDNLKQFESAIRSFGIDPDKEIDQLVFVSFRTKEHGLMAIGIAQGDFPEEQVTKRLKTKKVKGSMYHNTAVYPAGGMQMALLDNTTLVFGDSAALHVALDTRDGDVSSLNSNSQIANMLSGLDRSAVWSVLDQQGTQVMMKSALGDAAQLADYETVKKRLLGSRYTMDFNNGVKFDLDVFTSDNFSAASLSALVKAGVMYRKMSASGVEKVALDSVTVDSDSAKLQLHFSTDDNKFESLLHSDLFSAVSR
ncbi:MAG TPA: hypothetical protein VE998_12695 [Terriglobales bacterium]|nr:hypothetical protein [Terriglobales bacterium]